MEEEIQLPGTEPANQVDAKKVAPSGTTFGFNAVSLPTPKGVNAAFDIYLIVTTSFLGWIVATSLFEEQTTKEIVYFITLFATPVVKGISKMFGVHLVDETK